MSGNEAKKSTIDPQKIRIRRGCEELTSRAEAAAYWFSRFGFQVIPVSPGQKFPTVKWDEWLNGLNKEKVIEYWSKLPDHDVGFIVGDGMIVFDADTPESIAALNTIEESHGVQPKLAVKTTRGEHHYFRRAPGTFSSSDGHDSLQHPERIDIRTGKSMIILPPSTGKVAFVHEATCIDDLSEVDQPFIDSVYLMNGRDAPRPPEAPAFSRDRGNPTTLTYSNLKSLLDHLDPDLGYTDWTNALMAIFHETDGSDEGLELADEWSRKGKKYCGRSQVEGKWRSFRGDVANPITVATINKLLKDAGIGWQALIDPFEKLEVVEEGKTTTLSVVQKIEKEGTLLDKFSLTGFSADLEKAAVEQVPIFGRVALQGQATVWYAEPNSGKTLIAMKLLIEGIEAGNINPAKTYYLNMDDTSNGLYEKVKIAEEYGFHMLAEGYQGFYAKQFSAYIRELIAEKQAKGMVIILDTLKKFVDLMKKDKCSDFAMDIRTFVSRGGTVLALAHTNKNRRDGKPVPCGTSDIKDDFDCAFTIDTVTRSNERGEKVIEFENIKRRGNVAESAGYCYISAGEITYEEKLTSVRPLDLDQIAPIRQAEQIRSDAELIGVALECIQKGTTSKMLLAKAVAEQSGISRQTALQLIERYAGDDPTIHRWSFKRGAHGKQEFMLLVAASKSGMALTTLDNEKLYS